MNIKWLLNKIWKRADWEWHKLRDSVYRRFVRPPYVMTYEEMAEYVIDNKASIARFGDGELGVIHGRSLGFQKKDTKLGEMLKQTIRQNRQTLLVCIPDTFQRLERYNDVEQSFWKAHHYYNRRRWRKLLASNQKYGNTFLSRFYSMEFDKNLASGRIALLRRLWDGRDIIFVEGKDTKMGVGNDLFDNAKSIRRILCPSRDAFANYDRIVQAISRLQHSENDLYILALGPTATVMASELHHAGLQAFDLGHMDIEYEWYRQGATKKVPIQGKFSNEAAILGLAQSAVSGELRNDVYTRQIIMDLSE